MKFIFEINKTKYMMNTKVFHDISIPLKFNEEQPNTYNVKKASSSPYQVDDFIGDTRLGGSCNFDVLSMIPHCNGTHTECVGHITHERLSIQKQLNDILVPATLITITPSETKETNDTYDPDLNPEDLIITKELIVSALETKNNNFYKALVIRTLPNDNVKQTRNYLKDAPPFFSLEAITYIVALGIEHLLIDLPSVDRTFDEGKLNIHRIFWNIEPGSHEMQEGSYPYKTITEMIYVPDFIEDGTYMLNLQIAPFASDASPSRPVLFEINEQ